MGKVLANDRAGQTITVQPYRSSWLYVKIVHRPLYQGSSGHTTTPTGKDATDTVRYEALVKRVSLLKDGEIGHSDSRELLKGNWMLKLHEKRPGEALAALVCSAPLPLGALASMREDEDAQVANVKLGPTPNDLPAIMNTTTRLLHDGHEVVAAFSDHHRDRKRPPVTSASADGATAVSAVAPKVVGSRGSASTSGAPRDVVKENADSERIPDSKVLTSTWTQPATSKACYDRWMQKLDRGDLSGVPLPPGSYIPLRGNTCLLYTSDAADD